MIYTIPISSATSNYTQRASLDGVDFEFRFLWNDRDRRWYLDLANSSGELLASGRKIVANRPMHTREVSEDLPAGYLVFIDLGDEGIDPGLFDLDDRVLLLYADEDSS